MSTFAVEAAIIRYPVPGALLDRPERGQTSGELTPRDGRWRFALKARAGLRGSLQSTCSSVRAFNSWREAAEQLAPVRALMQDRMTLAPFCATMSALGFVPAEFEGDAASASDAIAFFGQSRRRRGRGAPRKPGVLSWLAECERGIGNEHLASGSIDRETYQRWRAAIAVAGPSEFATGYGEGYAVLSAQIFAECLAMNAVAASDVDVAGYAMAIAQAIRRVRWVQALSAAGLKPADELREAIAVIEAMPTFDFVMTAANLLSPAAERLALLELEDAGEPLLTLAGTSLAHGLALPPSYAIDVASLGPLRLKEAYQRAVRKRIAKPSRPAERDLVTIMAETFRALSGGDGPRTPRGVAFFHALNTKLRPGLQVSSEWMLRQVNA